MIHELENLGCVKRPEKDAGGPPQLRYEHPVGSHQLLRPYGRGASDTHIETSGVNRTVQLA